jgi:FkbM family methyltransferase
LDLGGCFGDTALYFADLVGENGKVYSFEFIPSNINVFNKNLQLNHTLSNRIELIERPVHEISGQKVFFVDNGPGSFVTNIQPNCFDGLIETLSIDDFVLSRDLHKIDFIKMDIEGAESKALKGALKTIERFKPKLAIAIYHSDDDFYEIPKFIKSLGYNICISHFTIHQEETICFATPIL